MYIVCYAQEKTYKDRITEIPAHVELKEYKLFTDAIKEYTLAYAIYPHVTLSSDDGVVIRQFASFYRGAFIR